MIVTKLAGDSSPAFLPLRSSSPSVSTEPPDQAGVILSTESWSTVVPVHERPGPRETGATAGPLSTIPNKDVEPGPRASMQSAGHLAQPASVDE